MSAYLCDDRHVNALISFAAQQENGSGLTYYFNGESIRVQSDHECQKAAEVLKAENLRSLAARYEDTDTLKEQPITFERNFFMSWQPLKLAVQILKACDCYDYQACESDDYEQTEAHALVDGIRSRAIGSLPGYEEAEWGWPTE